MFDDVYFSSASPISTIQQYTLRSRVLGRFEFSNPHPIRPYPTMSNPDPSTDRVGCRTLMNSYILHWAWCSFRYSWNSLKKRSSNFWNLLLIKLRMHTPLLWDPGYTSDDIFRKLYLLVVIIHISLGFYYHYLQFTHW